MTLAFPLQVDVEQLLYEFLSTDPDVVGLVGNRIYTVMPKHGRPLLPFVRHTRVAGSPLHNYPLALDQPVVQVDVWGVNKKQAWTVAATIHAVFSERLIGAHDAGTVCNYTIAAISDLPDADYNDPPQARYTFDVTLTTKPE